MCYITSSAGMLTILRRFRAAGPNVQVVIDAPQASFVVAPSDERAQTGASSRPIKVAQVHYGANPSPLRTSALTASKSALNSGFCSISVTITVAPIWPASQSEG
jgi:hypothetical protein